MDVCSNADVLKVIYFIMMLIDIVKIIIPIALIVLGLIDFSKAAITNDEKAQKKSGQLFLKRLLYGVIVFVVPWLVEVIMVSLGNLEVTDDDINFTDCLENAKKSCIDALDSKDINSIKSVCDVPDDFTIKEDNNDGSGGSSNQGQNNVITSDKNITFSYQYEKKSNGLSYALFTPSTAKTQEKVPLIIYLHGVGTRGIPKENFEKNLGQFKNTGLQNFNAYVLIPHMDDPDSGSAWSSGGIKNKFYAILDEVLASKNVDTDKIILMGHSMGGVGVYGIADGKTDLYSAFVIMSASYFTTSNVDQYKSVPVKGYVGSKEGEFEPAYEHMTEDFVETFGRDKLVTLDVPHGMIPVTAFKQDLNNDNKSDLIEWMLTQ